MRSELATQSMETLWEIGAPSTREAGVYGPLSNNNQGCTRGLLPGANVMVPAASPETCIKQVQTVGVMAYMRWGYKMGSRKATESLTCSPTRNWLLSL